MIHLKKWIKKKIFGIFEFVENTKWELIYEEYRNQYTIHPTFRFNGRNIAFYGNGKIIIGKNSYLGEYSSIQAYENCTVEIGENCSISHFVKIYTCNNNSIDIISQKKCISYKTGNVKIGNNCWIGVGVFIKEGITIGDNCVVGANSVVVKDIPTNSIAGGVPATILKSKYLWLISMK